MENITGELQQLQQIDLIAALSLQRQQEHLPDKYSKIEASLTLLQNLIIAFKKKADHHESQLLARAHILDLQKQLEHHRQRTEQCTQLAEQLRDKIQTQRKHIKAQEDRVKQLRQQMVHLKTDNVKKIMELEKLEQAQISRKQRQNQQQLKITRKLKTEFQRSFYRNAFPSHAHVLEALSIKKQQLISALFRHLQQVTRPHKALAETLKNLRQQLTQKERSANTNGLQGSLIFKIIQNTTQTRKKQYLPQPPPQSKLMLYDVLKNKHKRWTKQNRHEQETPKITWGEFKEYSPLQVLAVVELKGGLVQLQNCLTATQKRGSIIKNEIRNDVE